MKHRLPMYERVSERLQRRTRADVREPVGANPHGFRVFEYGDIAFNEIIERIDASRHTIYLRAFLWRDDEAGRRLGEAILGAAHRGVKVDIEKDRIAAVYEYAAGTKQSFFHKQVAPGQKLQAWFLRAFFRTPGSVKQRPNPLAEKILEHPNITVNHLHKRYDHSKVFIFDDEYITLGSMGIGDNHVHEWIDVVVELRGKRHVERFRDRVAGNAPFDPDRDVDFLVHNRQTAKKRECPMLEQRLALIEAARDSLTIEMAYMGDRRFTTALLRAVKRGVNVTLVTAARADVLGNLNRATCNTLMRRTGWAKNLSIILLPRMVHSKTMVVDHKISDVGSANFTPLSYGVYDEVNLYAVDECLARDLERVIAKHASEGEPAERRLGYRRFNSGVERAVMAYQSRKGGRLGRSHLPRYEILAIKREERDNDRVAKRQTRAAKRRHKQEKRDQRDARRKQQVASKRRVRKKKREQRESRKQERTQAKLKIREHKREARENVRKQRIEKKIEKRNHKREMRQAKRRVDKGVKSKARVQRSSGRRRFPRFRGGHR